jgi:hypothetical protein
MRRNVASIWLHLVLGAILLQVLGAGTCSAQCYTDYDNCGRKDICLVTCVTDRCPCQHHGWDGKRRISYQQQKDLFYNYYAQPGPFYNTPGKMYVSPLPVPANVGHTYVSYQPFMPHEYTYKHNRSYYTYNRGSGWTRTNVRYRTCCNLGQGIWADWHPPMSNNIWAVHNDFYYPGLRF